VAERVRRGSTVRSGCAVRDRACVARLGQTVRSSYAERGRARVAERVRPGSTVRSGCAVRDRACVARLGQTVRSSCAERGQAPGARWEARRGRTVRWRCAERGPECAARQTPGRRSRSTCEAPGPGTEKLPRRAQQGSTGRPWCAVRDRACVARLGQTVRSSCAERGQEPGARWETRRGRTVRWRCAERGPECAARQTPGRRSHSTCEALCPGTEKLPRRARRAQQGSTGRSWCAGRGLECAARRARKVRCWCAERGRASSARQRRAAIRPDSTGRPRAAQRGRECAAWRTPGSGSRSTSGVLHPGSEEFPGPARTPRGSRDRSWCAERGRGCVARCRGWGERWTRESSAHRLAFLRSRCGAGEARDCRVWLAQQVPEVSPARCRLERSSTLGGATRASSSSGSSREAGLPRCRDCSSGRSRASSGGGWARRMSGRTAEAVPGLLRRRVPRSRPEAVLGPG
jgi:hypothetical protein